MGDKKSVNLYIYEGLRKHEDSFVNIHNKVASMLFGCNTNIVNAVDGNSVMYITAYISKNSQHDDKKTFAEAAKAMVKKLNDILELMDSTEENIDQETIPVIATDHDSS